MSDAMAHQRIDMHCHFLPDFYMSALMEAGESKPDGIASLPHWDEHAAIEVMDQLGVQTSMLSISSPGVHFGDDGKAATLSRRLNEEAARLVRAHPGRFGFFAVTPLPDVDGAVAEACYALDTLGADGIMLETNHRGVYLGDERMEPLYAELDRRRAVVFLHPTSPSCSCCESLALGYPRPMLEFIFETTRSVTNLVLSGAAERHPNISVIIPHAGAALPVLLNRIELLLPMLSPPGSPKPADIRSALRRMHYDLAGAPVPELLGALLQIADHDRIHYGSDWPFTPTGICLAMAEKLDHTDLLDTRLRRAIMRDNAIALFPRLGA